MILEGELIIPVWEKGNWTTTGFKCRDDFKKFLIPLFKEPGLYEFDDASFLFNEQGNIWNKDKIYCTAPKGTRDFFTYWDDQKYKCRNGVIIKNKKKVWYLPREYYMLLNFLPIKNKEKGIFGFPDVRDAQYHVALYELLAQLHNLHAAVLKKRQILMSYYHMAKLTNLIWFEEGFVGRMGASLKSFVENSWGFMNEYRDHLNKETAWKRDFNPGGPLDWKQLDKDKVHGRWLETGLKGIIKGLSFEKSATQGVGGEITLFYYEEAGITKTMDTTFEFIRPAMKSGGITTGLFIASGSVGNLTECAPLQKMILEPTSCDIFPVKTNLIDADGTIGYTGLFIPEQWSMKPHIDKYGNSLVKEAEDAIDAQRYIWKHGDKTANPPIAPLPPDIYQLRISQHPKNIKEAFDFRTVSKFPRHLVSAQKKRIEDKEYPLEYVNLSRDATGKILVETSRKTPIDKFPISMTEPDKTGVIVVHERPIKNPELYKDYYASVDPVESGKTTTSESLCAIYIYKREVIVEKGEGLSKETYVERDKIVAWWCGRHDDLTKTHEQLELLIEWYMAWTLVEANVSSFVNYMIDKRKQKFLVQKNQMLFLKELNYNNTTHQEYGWKNTLELFSKHMLSYLLEFIREELEEVKDDKGNVYKITYGIERIPDIMALVEMAGYRDGVNVDRLVALASLVTFARIQDANQGANKRKEDIEGQNGKSQKIPKLVPSAFRHIGSQSKDVGKINKSPFKNIK